MLRMCLLVFVAPLVSGQSCNNGDVFEWERQTNLDGYLNTTGPVHTSRGLVHCGITCSQEPGCVSFFYMEQSRECKLQSVIVTTSIGLVPFATAKYFAPEQAGNGGGSGPRNISDCPAQWLPYGQSCYHFFETTSAFVYAENYCEGLNSHLVYVETTQENAFLLFHLNAAFPIQKWWLGLTDAETEGVYKWAGSNVIFDATLGDWYPGQPSPTFDCVFLNSNFNLQWYIGDCTRTDRSIICEIDIGS